MVGYLSWVLLKRLHSFAPLYLTECFIPTADIEGRCQLHFDNCQLVYFVCYELQTYN